MCCACYTCMRACMHVHRACMCACACTSLRHMRFCALWAMWLWMLLITSRMCVSCCDARCMHMCVCDRCARPKSCACIPHCLQCMRAALRNCCITILKFELAFCILQFEIELNLQLWLHIFEKMLVRKMHAWKFFYASAIRLCFKNHIFKCTPSKQFRIVHRCTRTNVRTLHTYVTIACVCVYVSLS